jgi:plasmid replication initiation protein
MEQIVVLSGNLSSEHIVCKSRPLVYMRDEFTRDELNVLDVYLSRINPHNSESREVRFTKREFEELLGLGKTQISKFTNYTDSFLRKVAEVRISKKHFKRIGVFSQFEFEKDEFGEWEVRMRCSEEAKEYIFSVETTGYIRFILKYSLALKNVYAYYLYQYVLDNRFRKTWSISVESLKKDVFRCENVEFYNQFKYFKRDALDKAVNEVNDKTDVKVSYRLIKRGRRITDIEFFYDSAFDEIEQLSLLEVAETSIKPETPDLATRMVEEEMSLIREVLPNAPRSFDDYEVKIIIDMVNNKIPYNPNRNEHILEKCRFLRSLTLRYEHFFHKKSARSNKAVPIPNPFEYYTAMISNEKV